MRTTLKCLSEIATIRLTFFERAVVRHIFHIPNVLFWQETPKLWYLLCCTLTFCCAAGSAEHLHSPHWGVFGYLALARGNVKQTHLRNKLLAFSICNRLPSMTKAICFEIWVQKPYKVYIQVTFLATENLMIYNPPLVAAQTYASTSDYFKCWSPVRLVLRIKSFSLTAAHFSLPFSFMSASVSA